MIESMLMNKESMNAFFLSLKRKGILVAFKTLKDGPDCANYTKLVSEETCAYGPIRSGTYQNWCNNNLVQFYSEDYPPLRIWQAIERCCMIQAKSFKELEGWNPYASVLNSPIP